MQGTESRLTPDPSGQGLHSDAQVQRHMFSLPQLLVTSHISPTEPHPIQRPLVQHLTAGQVQLVVSVKPPAPISTFSCYPSLMSPSLLVRLASKAGMGMVSLLVRLASKGMVSLLLSVTTCINNIQISVPRFVQNFALAINNFMSISER